VIKELWNGGVGSNSNFPDAINHKPSDPLGSQPSGETNKLKGNEKVNTPTCSNQKASFFAGVSDSDFRTKMSSPRSMRPTSTNRAIER
jgi:hypothetical protein